MDRDVLWGPQTTRALENFGRGQTPGELVRAYAEVKLACFSALQETGHGWDEEVFQALGEACREVISGAHGEEFPLPLQQGGAGTSLNQNINEVLAAWTNYRLQGEGGGEPRSLLHPIEDCNRFQSTNDTFSTAATLCFYRELEKIEASVVKLQEALIHQERRWRTQLLTGRTELQDALPMTLAQVFSSWAGLAERDRWRLHKLKERLRTVALGGTALGTGFGAPSAYVHAAERHLRRITGLPLSRSQNLTDEVAHLDKFAEVASGYDLAAGSLWKIAGDLLLYTSGFLGEMKHPVLQDGSTQMAAKTNPVLLELVRGLSLEVQGEAAKVRRYAQEGQLQLNAYAPFLYQALLKAGQDLRQALEVLAEKLLPHLEFLTGRMDAHLAGSPALLNALVPLLGYGKVKDLSQKWQEVCPPGQATLDRLAVFLATETGLEAASWRDHLAPGRITSFHVTPVPGKAPKE